MIHEEGSVRVLPRNFQNKKKPSWRTLLSSDFGARRSLPRGTRFFFILFFSFSFCLCLFLCFFFLFLSLSFLHLFLCFFFVFFFVFLGGGRRACHQFVLMNCLLPNRNKNGETRTWTYSSLRSSIRDNSSSDSENEQISKFSLIVDQKFRSSASSKPNMTEEVSRNWMELSRLKEEKLIMFLQEASNFMHHFLHEQLLKQTRDLREVHSLNEIWKKWSDFKGLHSMDFWE